MKSKHLLPLALACLMSMESCLLIHSPGYHSSVLVSADPYEAKVKVNGKLEHAQPYHVSLRKKFYHEFLFVADGYLDEKVELRPNENEDIKLLAMLSWFYTFGLTGLFDLCGSAYRMDLRRVEAVMTKAPEKASRKIPIGFGEITFQIEADKMIGTSYRVKGTHYKRPVGNVQWEKGMRNNAKHMIKAGIESLPNYGYETVDPMAGSKKDFSFSRPAKIIISGNVNEITYNKYNAEVNGYEDVNYEVNWVVSSSHGTELLKVSTKAYAVKYNASEREVFVAGFRKALFDLVSLPEFQSMLNHFDDSKSAATSVETTQMTQLALVAEPAYASRKEMMREVLGSVVTVITDKGHGSGFIIAENGLLITNHHVIEGAKSVEVQFTTGLKLAAEKIKVSVADDVALLKVNGSGFKPLFVKQGDESQAGEEVFAIGTPEDLSLGQSVTSGIISGKRELDGQSFIQTDVKVNSGNSGGPLIDKKGQVIGIINAKLKGEGIEGISFAIPTSRMIRALNLKFQ